jgi:hypothetical protein
LIGVKKNNWNTKIKGDIENFDHTDFCKTEDRKKGVKIDHD